MKSRITRNVSLPSELGDLIESKVTSGRYPSAVELVRSALRLFDEWGRSAERQLQPAMEQPDGR
ncbi:type II toxin-antitoxin system ParD family antitoxin [Microvirga guangxiensis]|uniref:ribbon-helix-helix domain-containing protein n=1 Tax=Microvirga guangxiensis TaxID=549386 RepID=UPI000B844149